MTPIFSTMPIALSGGTTLASVLTLVLSVVLWVGLSIFIGWTLSKVMHNQGMKTKPVFIMVISAVFSILLIARYGLSITAIQ
jgi:membrane protein DedA with SNARE-associated domain